MMALREAMCSRSGPMRPEQGVQRGSVMNDNGDPSTPGYPSTPVPSGSRCAQMAIPHIPVVPLSYRNAAELLRGIHDRGAPCVGVGLAICVARDPELRRRRGRAACRSGITSDRDR